MEMVKDTDHLRPAKSQSSSNGPMSKMKQKIWRSSYVNIDDTTKIKGSTLTSNYTNSSSNSFVSFQMETSTNSVANEEQTDCSQTEATNGFQQGAMICMDSSINGTETPAKMINGDATGSQGINGVTSNGSSGGNFVTNGASNIASAFFRLPSNVSLPDSSHIIPDVSVFMKGMLRRKRYVHGAFYPCCLLQNKFRAN